MPYRSKAQMAFAFATHQKWARKWADETKAPDKLPERAGMPAYRGKRTMPKFKK